MSIAQRILDRFRVSRHTGLYFTGLVILSIWTLLRIGLLVRCWSQTEAAPADLAKVFLSGLALDLAAVPVLLLPTAIWVAAAPARWFQSRASRWILVGEYFLVVYGVLFGVVAEWLFWDEFEHRFNFIAVDYIVYTQEVLTNIGESYPVVPLLCGLFVLASAIVWPTRHIVLAVQAKPDSWHDRLAHLPAWLGYTALVALWIGPAITDMSRNSYLNEVAKNGPLSLVEAFYDSTLDYEAFYATRDPDDVFGRMHDELTTTNAKFTSDDPFNLERLVTNAGRERQANVVIVLVESLSAEYLGSFGNTRGITPHLDKLADESLVFTNFYATGTRTVRGMEAICLSIPPTPGCAVIKRPSKTRFPALFDMFQQRGYDTTFLMGGNAYFDNHRGFFEKQGCRVLDRSSFRPDEIHFANAWGVCDEDLFGMTLREADEQHRQNRPFCFLTLTCSNHRPYTYPQVIDTPSGASREGAVKYTDHAIGEMLRKAKEKPWFDNTIFVIVADHCASSAGKTPVPAHRYHIPMFVYAPKLVRPGKFDGLCSQIDVGPTLLGLLNFTYRSQFFGSDVLQRSPNRAFIGTYQRLGMLLPEHLTVLDVKRKNAAYMVASDEVQPPEEIDEQRLARAIAYYQSASQLLKRAEQAAEHERTSSGEQRTVAVQKHVANAPAIARAPR